jgi:hypothetical protein
VKQKRFNVEQIVAVLKQAGALGDHFGRKSGRSVNGRGTDEESVENAAAW